MPIHGAPWDGILSYWQQSKIPPREGVSPQTIDEFERRYGVVLPAAFAEYIKILNGTGADHMDDAFCSFLPLQEIRPVHEVLDETDGVVYADRFAYPDCYVFVDYLLGSWFYAVQMTSDPLCPGAAYRVTCDNEPGPMEAASFSEFMCRYADDPESIV